MGPIGRLLVALVRAVLLGGCGLLSDGGAESQVAVDEAREDFDEAIAELFRLTEGGGAQELRSPQEVEGLLDDFEDSHERWEDAVDAMFDTGAEPDGIDPDDWPAVRTATRDWVRLTRPFVEALGECQTVAEPERFDCLSGSLGVMEDWQDAARELDEVLSGL